MESQAALGEEQSYEEVNHWEEKLKERIMGTSTEKTKLRNGKSYPAVNMSFMHYTNLSSLYPIYT